MTRFEALRSRLSSERGMSLIELLVAMPIGLVLVFATIVMMIVSIHQSANVTDRVEAIQRGRTTMERVVRQLRSQVCPATTGAAITAGSDNSVTFYVDLTGGSSAPERHTLTYIPPAGTTPGRLTQDDYVGTGTWPNLSYPGTATRSHTLHSHIKAVTGTPFFTYYAYTATGSVSNTPLSTPLSATDLQKVVRTKVSFVSEPTRTTQPERATTFASQADTRTTDPTDPTQGARCL